MRWIAVAALFLALAGAAPAAGPEDEYLDIYNEILQGDSLQQNGHPAAAAIQFRQALAALQQLQAAHTNWNTDVVNFRLEYLAQQLRALAKYLPPTNAPSPVVTPPPVAAPPVKPPSEVDGLRGQVSALTAANTQLQDKLKEALSVQPAAVSPAELAKAGAQNVALQKERDLLTVALAQAKSAAPAEADKAARAEIVRLKESLAAAERQIETLKSSPAAKEEEKLRKELAARSKDLADIEAHRGQASSALESQFKQVEQQRDDLQRQLAAASSAGAEADQLRARLAVLEAKAVPFTPEELAVLDKNSVPPPAPLPAEQPASTPPNTNASPPVSAPAAPAAPAQRPHVVHSMKDLPPGAGALMTEAVNASRAGDFAGAAAKFEQILRQDENNVYVLAHLGHAQLAQNKLDESEKTVQRALALDPDDWLSLYVLGNLRYRQHKLDEAFDALSRSAQFNPTNAGIQYYLGRTLADKGLLPAAETAFRSSLASDKDSAEAHYSLAFIYATEKPPSPALARWHYKRAVDLGHPKSPELEKLLAPPQ
jgi:tetratricopeptide (TPR) repeat protein